MQLHEAGKILSTFSEDLANENISNGWVLLAVTTGTNEAELQPCYVLGKPAHKVGMVDSVIELNDSQTSQ